MSASVAVDLGSFTRMSEMAGPVPGGRNTEHGADASERDSTRPSKSFLADHATARYQMRRQPGTAVASVKVITGAVMSSVARGGPIVSPLLASNSLVVRKI